MVRCKINILEDFLCVQRGWFNFLGGGSKKTKNTSQKTVKNWQVSIGSYLSFLNKTPRYNIRYGSGNMPGYAAVPWWERVETSWKTQQKRTASPWKPLKISYSFGKKDVLIWVFFFGGGGGVQPGSFPRELFCCVSLFWSDGLLKIGWFCPSLIFQEYML